MRRYCDGCENRCPMDMPQCMRGARYYRDEFDDRPGEDRRRGGRKGMFHGDRPPFDDRPYREDMPPRGPEGHGHGGRGPEGRGPEGRGPEGHGPEGRGRPPRPMPNDAMLHEKVNEADLGELLRLCGRLMPREPGGHGRGQDLVLSILAGREAMSQRELQQLLAIQPGSVSEIVSKLEKKGCVTRERGEDRRGNTLRITDAGREAIARDPERDADDPFSVLTTEQQDQLAAMLRTLLNHWIDHH